MSRQRRTRRRARTLRDAYRPRKTSTDLVVEATNKLGTREHFTIPLGKLGAVMRQLPSLRAQGFSNIKITSAA